MHHWTLPLPLSPSWSNPIVDSENGVLKFGGLDPFNLGSIVTFNIFPYFGGFNSATTMSAAPCMPVDPNTLSDGLVNSPNKLGEPRRALGISSKLALLGVGMVLVARRV